jgi:ribonuclease P protein component
MLVLVDAPGTGRSAVVASAKVGGSVERNRARRIMREAWRQVGGGQAGIDAVLVARRGIVGAKTAGVAGELKRMLEDEREPL